ncbi:MAG TPA: DUF3761 domain-containing protein [Gaiellaceae bacterium]|nr:DUF3761 domain-containing protein [Gaiellaceae bacterium]
MPRRPLRLAMIALLGFVGIGLLVVEQDFNRQSAADRAAQRQLAPEMLKTRKLLIAQRARNAALKAELLRLHDRQKPLLQEHERAEQSAYRGAYVRARRTAYRDAYLTEFPIEVNDGEEWFIVKSTAADALDVWTADAEHEFQIQDGEPYRYAFGEAPAEWEVVGGVNVDGSEGYVNVDGDWVPSPFSNPNLEPEGPGPSAICADGTYSYSRNNSGTCSYHGGVSSWLP